MEKKFDYLFFFILLADYFQLHEQEPPNCSLYSFTLSICRHSLDWCAHLCRILCSFWILRTHDHHVQHRKPVLFIQSTNAGTHPLFLQPSVDCHWTLVGRYIKRAFQKKYSNNCNSNGILERFSLDCCADVRLVC